MPYLIDGHNVIGQTRGLSLEDPDDELKLVRLVRQLCMRERRAATIIFDGGLPGGVSDLSTSDVKVIFASENHTSADDLIIKRIGAEKNPQGMIVITSDQKIANTARGRRMTVKSSGEFGEMLFRKSAATPQKEKGISAEDVAEWEELFKRGD
jgi:predicted RNA-binding protein with PIN domain